MGGLCPLRERTLGSCTSAQCLARRNRGLPSARAPSSAPCPSSRRPVPFHCVGSAGRSAVSGPIPEGGIESAVSYGADTVGAQLP